MRLLPLKRFEPVFGPLAGRRIGVVDGYGNPGDRLLDASTRQLLQAFGLTWRNVNPLADPPGSAPLDVLLLAGGGSMGGPRECQIHRLRALAWGLPCVLLPQSFHAPEDCACYERVWVRERASLELCPAGALVPDLSLGYDWPETPEPHLERGVFLRAGGHALWPGRAPDPAGFCYTAEDYIALAAAYRHVVTDRLHFAITALGLGRRATLLPVAYHKNRSMWETWLRDLGCAWADEPP